MSADRAAWVQLPAHHQAAESSPLQVAFSPECCPGTDLGGFGARGGKQCLLGEEQHRASGCARCELGVPLAHSTAATALSLSPGVVCVKERELKEDLLCHPDFGFCHCEFLFSFWKLLFSSLLGSPRGIETHRRAHPRHPPSNRSYGGSGEVGLGIFDHNQGKSVSSMLLFFS